jgi:hypothetical protein
MYLYPDKVNEDELFFITGMLVNRTMNGINSMFGMPQVGIPNISGTIPVIN